MDRKLKLALAALLGFSTACSSVKNAPKEEGKPARDADTTTVVKGVDPNRRIVVMYGVRINRPDTMRMQRSDADRPDSLPPVAERPGDEDTPVPTGK